MPRTLRLKPILVKRPVIVGRHLTGTEPNILVTILVAPLLVTNVCVVAIKVLSPVLEGTVTVLTVLSARCVTVCRLA